MASIWKSKEGHDESCSPAPTPQYSGLAGFNLNDLADEGQRQLDQSQRDAKQLLEDARAEADEIRREARRQGYQDGMDQAAIDAESRLQAAAIERAQSGLDLVQDAVDQLHTAHQKWMDHYAESLSAIALAATRKVVSRELSYDPKLIVQWAQQAVQSTRAACRLTVGVHPETLALIGQSLDEMLASHHLPEQTFVEPDETVTPTEVVIRQVGGEIQAGLNAQLRRLEELLA